MSEEDGPLWTIHIPGGGIKKVHLPPLPDRISWVVNFKDGRAKRYSFPINNPDKIDGGEK